MHATELHFDADSGLDVKRRIEEVAVELGLAATMVTTLAGYPGCTHWHFKKLFPNRRGLAHFAESAEQNVPVPFSAAGLETASKRGKQRGVLEATYWPGENRAWLTYRSGRDADWIPAAIRQFQRLLNARIGRS